MTRVTQVYQLKLPQERLLLQRVGNLYELAKYSSQRLLEKLWSEEWLDRLDNSKNSNQNTKIKAYKIIGENQVTSTSSTGESLYFPSRIRRCIAEQVGRILRSQSLRKNCYYDVLHLVQQTGVEGNLDELVRILAQTLVRLEGKYYRRALIRQVLRTFRRYHYRLGLEMAVFTRIPYTQLVKPHIWSFVLPFAPDDGQVIQHDWQDDVISIRLKLPITKSPVTRNEWAWHEFTLLLSRKLLPRIQPATSKIHQPTLRYLTLKGGLTLPFLEYAWSSEFHCSSSLNKKRVLAADLGAINLTTSVICEAGSQISPPIFWTAKNSFLHKLEQLYHHLIRLQKKLSRYPEVWLGQGKRKEEYACLFRKLNRYREQLLHLTSNHLIDTALQWHCQTIVLEDLRSYDPPKHLRKLSRKLSNWFRGALYDLLAYKAKRVGIKLTRVLAWWTSSYCPRCGKKGSKIRDPESQIPLKEGRFFFCLQCQFSADRDYAGSLNIYRMYQEQRQNRYRLQYATPVSYTGTGIPPNRPGGASAQVFLGG
ncbi:MAG: RNA-guided endonuclease InsQ/TnpB family protein [Candidatus Hodarchaeales archaeon]